MTLLEQCQIWNDQNEYQKIVDAIEAVPAGARTPELDSELARAYNNLAGPGDSALFEKALALLKPHEAYFRGDYAWNFRMGYSYYYLDQEGAALRHFERALEARPGDQDAQSFLENCRRCLALPRFQKNFRVRAEEAWAAFAAEEDRLRAILEADGTHERGEEILALCAEALRPALGGAAIEVGFNGEKYQLILSPEGSRAGLFPLVYFRRHAPEKVLRRWDILVGRQPARGLGLRLAGWEVSAEEVRVWIDAQGEEAGLTLWCGKLQPLFPEEREKAWTLLSILTDQVLGEVNAIAHVREFTVAETAMEGPSVSLAELPRALQERGMTFYRDAEDFLENGWQAYRLDPTEDRDADWRLDVYAGSTRLPALIAEYLQGESGTVDALHRAGIAAGFLIYPLEDVPEENRAERILDFRDALLAAVQEQAGPEWGVFLGGATGLYCGYVDFLAWDLDAVLSAARDFFDERGLSWSSFHSFRREVGTVALTRRSDPDPETGSLLSRADIEAMEAMSDSVSGYYGRMLDYLLGFIRKGIEAGRFSERQARQDLQIALWYAYACNNMDEYEFYYRTASWMPDSERSAGGCGAWYYRYSCALMYCGRLEEARDCAERGLREEPDYPWGWLQAAKLRAHFGDRAGALAAVERGLTLEPGDYEFLTLRQEIREGASLEQMEYHWINPSADRRLREGLDQGADDKQRAISCITTDRRGLERFLAIFRPDPEDYEKNAPYCVFHRIVQGRRVEVVFRMNEAGLSKLREDWLLTQRDRLDSGRWLTLPLAEGEEGTLESVFFGLDCRVCLVCRAGDRGLRIWLDQEGEPDFSTLEYLEEQEPSAPAEYYTEAEMDAVERHITGHFGPVEHVFHELVSPDIHVDVCVAEPTEERACITLVTMGMGAHRMNLPEELAGRGLERAELAISLPPDWPLDEASLGEERWYWPVRLLKALARLPIDCDTWLGWGHTMDNGKPFAEGTELCGALLTGPQGTEEGAETCLLPNGETVNFYQVIPLYRGEMEFKQRHSAEELLDRLEEAGFVVCPDRPRAVEEEPEELPPVMDDGAWHLESIREKRLPVEELAAYSHMAVYLRWCMEHDLMSLGFLEQCWDAVQQLRNDPEHTDLRPLIRDELGGQLTYALFDEEGEAFARFYYSQYGDGGDGPSFPRDVDGYALEYFGPERYRSDEFRDEAYLFLPFDEDCYQALARVIRRRWERWKGEAGG